MMKISGIDPGLLRVGVDRPERPAGIPGTGNFADLLTQALREPTAAPAAAVSVQAVAELRPVEGAPAVETAARVESFLDRLDRYRQALSDPRADMQVLDGAVRDMETGMETLTPALGALPEKDGLKDIIRHTLVTASVEIAKFRRGDYPAA